ncbi:hypothetical protein PHISCL_00225 [Aspergillus sclerotialis]|uniref:Uncharacterized protein n=1 Tax=Aspergillus sclerotialis TaxID=2070753 RepID=A0A3A3ADU8_9EURO|nr:hypothetical protein PHISCL_00225 [Aspergillus sclerotialis]
MSEHSDPPFSKHKASKSSLQLTHVSYPPDPTFRREYKQGPITVVIGYGDGPGYFMSVYDTRLQINIETEKYFDSACFSVDIDGLGGYFNVYTGVMGWGTKVNLEAMDRFWRLYGIEQSDIDVLLENRQPASAPKND